MRQLANDKKLATQMGNQGSAESGLRRAVEVIQAGVIGKPLELHVWSNRPIWPQGFDRPAGEDPVPPDVDWDAWIGPAAMRPYKNGIYHTFAWRGWYDFGTGALGDMACHTVNMPFRALKLGYPTRRRVRSRLPVLPGDLPQDLAHPLRVPGTRRPAAAEVLVVRREPWRNARSRRTSPRENQTSSPVGRSRQGDHRDSRRPARQRRAHRRRQGQDLLSGRLRRPVLPGHERRGGIQGRATSTMPARTCPSPSRARLATCRNGSA